MPAANGMTAVHVVCPSLAILADMAVVRSAKNAAQSVGSTVVPETAGFHELLGADHTPEPLRLIDNPPVPLHNSACRFQTSALYRLAVHERPLSASDMSQPTNGDLLIGIGWIVAIVGFLLRWLAQLWLRLRKKPSHELQASQGRITGAAYICDIAKSSGDGRLLEGTRKPPRRINPLTDESRG